jgi:hypothetical protein
MLDTGHRRYDGKPALSEFVSAADCHQQRLQRSAPADALATLIGANIAVDIEA